MNTDLWQIYKDDKIDDALKGVFAKLGEPDLSDEARADLLRLQAWCHYQREEYAEALNIAEQSTHPLAGCVIVCVMANEQDFMDRKRFYQLLEDLDSELDALNAAAIDGFHNCCEANALTLREKALTAAKKWNPMDPDVRIADIALNVAKMQLRRYQKGWYSEDLPLAICYAGMAIQMYGTKGNFDLRAIAYSWLSEMYEASGAIGLAVSTQETSIQLWQRQCQLHPAYQGQELRDGVERLKVLEATLQGKTEASLSSV